MIDDILNKDEIKSKLLNDHHVCIDINNKLGSGMYGVVYLGTWYDNEVAIKIQYITTMDNRKQYETECLNMKQLLVLENNQNILNSKDSFILKNLGFIILDKMPNISGTLDNIEQQCTVQTLTRDEFRLKINNFCILMCSIYKYCNFIHNDIHYGNLIWLNSEFSLLDWSNVVHNCDMKKFETDIKIACSLLFRLWYIERIEYKNIWKLWCINESIMRRYIYHNVCIIEWDWKHNIQKSPRRKLKSLTIVCDPTKRMCGVLCNTQQTEYEIWNDGHNIVGIFFQTIYNNWKLFINYISSPKTFIITTPWTPNHIFLISI